ncbi:hypothetical protein [Yersinia pestis]|uniref:hypothetical protein n=1 Tax=Yersinia pestis TaxID=632 RepID=UPI00345CD31B
MTHILHKKIGDCAFWVKKDISYKLAEKYAVEGDRAEDEPINILRHSRRFFICAYKALLPAAP